MTFNWVGWLVKKNVRVPEWLFGVYISRRLREKGYR